MQTRFFLVSQVHGGPWDWSKDIRAQALFGEHAQFVDELVDKGVIVLGGPLDAREVLLVVRADSATDVREQFADDPWIRDGMLTITEVREWTVLLDGTSRSR